MNKKLVLITAGFPFGTHETFLETEIAYLSEGFEQVTIVTVDATSTKQRPVPSNCNVVALTAQLSGVEKWLSILGILNRCVWQEFNIINNIYHQRLTLGKLKTMLISLARAKKIRRKLNKRILLNHNTVLYSYWCDDAALAIAMFNKYNKVVTVSRVHGWDLYFNVHALNYLPFRHYITNQLNAVYPISQKGKDYITEKWKVSNPGNLIPSRLGVSAQRKVIPSGTFTLVSCSNLIPLKRVELIIGALSYIHDISLVWVHFGDGPEGERLERLAKEQLRPNITCIFKGHISNEALMEWYRENSPSLFINVSSSEGIPVSIMEAMSFGIPVIATNVGGNGEIVNDSNGKLLSDHPSTQEVAEAICEFFDSSIAEAKGEAAYLTWKEMYNADANYREFVKTLQNIT